MKAVSKQIRRPLVAIVVPVFNKKDSLLRFMDSIARQDYKNHVLVVVDDASTDGTVKAIKARRDKTVVLEGNGNLWWSGGTNLGAKYALKNKADYVLTINHDVILDKNYISSLVDFAHKHPQALIGSMVVNRQKKTEVWFFGAGYNKRTGLNEHVTGHVKDFTEPAQSTWLTGMGVLIPVGVFKKIGFYDDKNYPLYFGDADFSERARRAGFELWINPKSRVYGDIHDNWIGKNVRRPKVRFIYDMFVSIHSPFQWKTRRSYYKLYWPGNYTFGLAAFYIVGSASVYYAYVIGLAKKILGIKKTGKA